MIASRRQLVSVAKKFNSRRLHDEQTPVKKNRGWTGDTALLRSSLSAVHLRSWKPESCGSDCFTPFLSNFAETRKTSARMHSHFKRDAFHQFANSTFTKFHFPVNQITMATVLRFLLAAICSSALAGEPNWVREAAAQWSPRDSQAEWVFRDQIWIGGGWFNSYESPPRDVWASADGRDWSLVQSSAPWKHSDLPMNLTFSDKIWIMGGWYNGRLPGHSAGNQVWSSDDGIDWRMVTERADWSARCAGVAVEFQQKIWLLGGTENYYFGDNQSLKNDVWSATNGKDWQLECAHAEWRPRAYHQAVVMGDRLFVLGGGNYVPEHLAFNDVWSTRDGTSWQMETESAPWAPRIWFTAVSYRNRIWVLGGWSQETGNLGDVWHSEDGRSWKQFQSPNCWNPRHEHSAFVWNDKLWIAGGHANPLSNEIWSLYLPADWKPE